MFQNYYAKGRTTNDLRLTFLPDGKAVANFTLAVNRKNSTNTDFIPCVLWGDDAKKYTDIVGKGSLIFIEGEMRSSMRDNEDGGKDYFYQIEVSFLDILKGKDVMKEENKKD